jgi:hypothetical protein
MSLQSSGVVNSFVNNGNGTYTITTNDIGNLEIGFKVVLKYTDTTLNRDIIISAISGNTLTFLGTNITQPDTWEMALYFEHGHRIELNKKYINKAKSVNKMIEQFPLVWLYTDFEERPPVYEDSEFITTLQFALVNRTDKDLYEDQRITQKFKPVLYYIKDLIKEAFNGIYKRTFITPFGNTEIKLMVVDRPFFGSPNGENVLPDPTDAIEFQVELNWRKEGSICTGY